VARQPQLCRDLRVDGLWAHYETTQETRGGLNILVRPIRPEDAQLFAALFNTLSPTTIYYRFFSYMRSLTPEMLARMTQIDYDREMALVAIDRRTVYDLTIDLPTADQAAL
jgi:acetyltransferase